MAGFWERILGRGGKGSGATAKQRLQFVLVHDRINLPPEKLAQMKQEILAVISKYVAVDEDHVDIALQQGDRRGSMLKAEVPFTKAKEGVEVDENDDKMPALDFQFKSVDELEEAQASADGTEHSTDKTPSEETKDEGNDKTQPHKS